MNPIIQWRLEKNENTLRVFLKTEEKEMEECFHKNYLYTYKMVDEMKAMEPYNAVEVFINSRGGDFRSAMGIYDALRKVKPSIPIRTLITGTCASAATIFLGLRGPKYIVPSGSIFIHFGTATVTHEDGTTEETKESLAVDAAMEILNAIYRKEIRRNLGWSGYRSMKDKPMIWAAEETRFGASEAKENGLVKDVLSQKAFESEAMTEQDRKKMVERWKWKQFGISGAIIISILMGMLGYGWHQEDARANRVYLRAGVVVEKKYEPPVEMPIMLSSGWTSAGFGQVYVDGKRGEGWLITIQDNEQKQTYAVAKSTYEKVNVGDRIRFDDSAKEGESE